MPDSGDFSTDTLDEIEGNGTKMTAEEAKALGFEVEDVDFDRIAELRATADNAEKRRNLAATAREALIANGDLSRESAEDYTDDEIFSLAKIETTPEERRLAEDEANKDDPDAINKRYLELKLADLEARWAWMDKTEREQEARSLGVSDEGIAELDRRHTNTGFKGW